MWQGDVWVSQGGYFYGGAGALPPFPGGGGYWYTGVGAVLR